MNKFSKVKHYFFLLHGPYCMERKVVERSNANLASNLNLGVVGVANPASVLSTDLVNH